MKNLFEASIAARSLMRERTPAAVEDWEMLMWLNQAATDLARRSLCFEKEAIVPTTHNIRKYEWKYVLPDFLDKVRGAWYRNYPLRLLQDVDKRGWLQAFFTSTSTQPLDFYYDSQFFGIKWIPSVSTYAVGTASFTPGSATVTGAGTSWLTLSTPAAHWAIGAGAEPNKYYSIRSVESDTSLTLDEVFQEPAVVAGSYLSTDGSVRLLYVASPPVLRNISYTTGLTSTVTVTNGSRTVTTSGAPLFTTTTKRGMHLGVGTATGSTKPSRWYLIRKINSDTSLELSQAYEETTVAGTASVVLTDDSPFEPSLMEACIFYAASMGLAKYSHPDAEKYLVMYEAKVLQTKQEVDSRYQRNSPPPRIQDTYHGFLSEIDG